MHAIEMWDYVHIDGCESAVGDGAADGTSESESRVEVKTLGGSRVSVGSQLSLCGVNLAGASGSRRRSGRHFAGLGR
jgi:hypothetical protein